MTWLRDVRWGPFLTGTATLVPMHHIQGLDRDQAQLLPARVDDYVEADNPVRFIDAFVDGLDLQEAGFARVQPKPTGRPGYDPADLLKLYIYGYVNRVRSSRRLVGLNLSNRQIALELGLSPSDVQAMTEHLRRGLVAKVPAARLEGEVEVDEVYVVAGHKGQPAAVAKRGGSGAVAGWPARRAGARWRRTSHPFSA